MICSRATASKPPQVCRKTKSLRPSFGPPPASAVFGATVAAVATDNHTVIAPDKAASTLPAYAGNSATATTSADDLAAITKDGPTAAFAANAARSAI